MNIFSYKKVSIIEIYSYFIIYQLFIIKMTMVKNSSLTYVRNPSSQTSFFSSPNYSHQSILENKFQELSIEHQCN